MTAQLTSLVDKVDNSEIVRDKIGAILLEESEAQRALATAAGRDATQWELRVFAERANPWSDWLRADEEAEQSEVDPLGRKLTSPIVNVWFDQATMVMAGSNLVEKQKYTGVFNIDCYGYGETTESSEGQSPGDAKASLEAQRAARLVRNFLMGGVYTYLGLQGTVARRWVESIQVKPAGEERATQHVVCARVALHVDFIELSPQVEGQPLELISVGVSRLSDGLLYFTANYPHGA